jgi:hypothetical protein
MTSTTPRPRVFSLEGLDQLIEAERQKLRSRGDSTDPEVLVAAILKTYSWIGDFETLRAQCQRNSE